VYDSWFDLAVVGGRWRLGRVVSGVLLAAGSLLTRFGVFDAGKPSARDPKYTVVPQRERMASPERAAGAVRITTR
jgi:hypothetical protein